MDQDIINITTGAVLALLGWLGKTLWDAVAKLKEDIKEIEIDLPKTYVAKADLDSRLDKIDQILDKIFDRLEHKADRSCHNQERL